MPLIINGVVIDDVRLNGVAVDTLRLNGVVVYEGYSPFFDGFDGSWTGAPSGWQSVGSNPVSRVTRSGANGQCIKMHNYSAIKRYISISGVTLLKIRAELGTGARVVIRLGGTVVMEAARSGSGFREYSVPITGFSGTQEISITGGYPTDGYMIFYIDEISLT